MSRRSFKPKPSDLFISYAHADIAYVELLADHLATVGLPVTFDRDLPWGARFVGELRTRIVDAAGVLVVMSPAADASEWVERETLEALRSDRPIFPVLLSGETLFLLSSRHYFDGRGGRLPVEDDLAPLRAVLPPRHFAPAEHARREPALDIVRALGDQPAQPHARPGDDHDIAPRPHPPRPLQRLSDLLISGEWEHADIWTTSVLLAATDRLAEGFIRNRDRSRLSAQSIAQVERLWAQHSQGRFGFRRQLELMESSNGSGRPTGGRRGFRSSASALGWPVTESPVPRYRGFTADTWYQDGFFPTLRNPQQEAFQSWYDNWLQTVVSVHTRLREVQEQWNY